MLNLAVWALIVCGVGNGYGCATAGYWSTQEHCLEAATYAAENSNTWNRYSCAPVQHKG